MKLTLRRFFLLTLSFLRFLAWKSFPKKANRSERINDDPFFLSIYYIFRAYHNTPSVHNVFSLENECSHKSPPQQLTFDFPKKNYHYSLNYSILCSFRRGPNQSTVPGSVSWMSFVNQFVPSVAKCGPGSPLHTFFSSGTLQLSLSTMHFTHNRFFP